MLFLIIANFSCSLRLRLNDYPNNPYATREVYYVISAQKPTNRFYRLDRSGKSFTKVKAEFNIGLFADSRCGFDATGRLLVKTKQLVSYTSDCHERSKARQ